MTNYQLELLLELFKSKENDGWRLIATKLLTTGECIVASVSDIWKGGVGNYITVFPLEDSYGCYKYVLNRKLLLESSWLQDYLSDKIANLKFTEIEIGRRIYELEQLTNK